ncbi:hypothetical protein Ancab_012037 [Ancistrocladus abbreviatus]
MDLDLLVRFRAGPCHTGPKPGGLGCDSGKRENMRLQVEKVKLGSRPPGCENKCLSCKPCIATLVVPPHQKRGFGPSSYDHGDFDSYYHLSWKCKCGNRLFQH